ncbi:MAG: molybdopterin-dependent oxidoreductase [Actinobacteria bacterium]|nr:molybdopterin-dependent oxidoreductase [Actinomycetota bacterium]
MKKYTQLFALLLCLCLVAPASANAATKATPTPTLTNPYGAAPMDPPGPNEVLLTLKKGTKIVKFTMKQLMALKPATVTISEPFVKKRQSFSSIPLSVLFAKVGISGSDLVATKALNDYIYSNTAAKFVSAKGYLAVQREGKDIPFDQGGPIRIIFPSNSVWATFLDPWNWSLMSISVK